MIGIALVNQLEKRLWPHGATRDVWMIVDSARDPQIYGLLLECFYSTHVCLFAGLLAPELKLTAPYLVPLDHDYKKTRRFLRAAWGNNWGVYLRCNSRPDALRRHLRTLLTITDPQGRRLLFRFYDPRVLRRYLPSCNSGELQRIFGSIECFWTEDDNAAGLLEFSFDELDRLQPNTPGPSTGTLAIRREQMAIFSHAEVEKFVDWMLVHLRRFFPRQTTLQDELQLRRTVESGIQRASAYGLTAKRDVCKYIDLMLVLGENFDTDKQLPWAAQILSYKTHPALKAQFLLHAGINYLRQPGTF